MAEEPENPVARKQDERIAWLSLTRAVSMAFDVRKILMGVLGLLLLQAGWIALDRLMPGSATATSNMIDLSGRLQAALPRPGLESITRFALWRVTEPARVLIAPLRDFFSSRHGIDATAHALLSVLWTLAVFGVVGGAISRSAVVEAANGERLSLIESLKFGLKFKTPLIATPLFPLIGAVLCGLISAGFGLLCRLPGIAGELAAGVTFIIPLTMGLVMALLLLNLVAAWPLMHASIAAEAEDSLDALSRSSGYVNRRPVKFALFVAVAWLAGAVGLIAVEALAGAALHLAGWGMSFTAPAASLDSLSWFGFSEAPLNPSAGTFPVFWAKVVRLLTHAWIYGYYWSSAALIYLSLRHDVDDTPWSKVKGVEKEAL